MQGDTVKALKKGKRKNRGGTGSPDILQPAKRFQCKPPSNLSDIKAVRREIARVYRYVWEQKVFIEDATRLVFILNAMIQAFKDEAALAALQNQYQDAWSGVGIIAPTGKEGALLAAPATQEIIPPAKSEEETDESMD